MVRREQDRSASTSAVAKALEVLSSFGAYQQGMGVADISRVTGLSSSTVHRILQTLEAYRFVEQDPRTRRYNLSYRVIELSHDALAASTLRNNAAPMMPVLARATKATAVTLGVLTGHMITYLARIECMDGNPGAGFVAVGRRTLAHTSAIGKSILAYSDDKVLDEVIATVGLPRLTERTITDPLLLKEELAKIRETGYAIDNEEAVEGICCIGAPIRGSDSSVIGAISVSRHKVSLVDTDIRQLALHVLDVAAQISSRMGFSG